jgi:hypothetical protein
MGGSMRPEVKGILYMFGMIAIMVVTAMYLSNIAIIKP